MMKPIAIFTRFSAELRRRHVFRVALAYCAVGWVVAEVSATFLPALGVPSWSVTLVAMLLILGLPIALVLAWAFDITPDGVRRTPSGPAAPPRSAADGPALVALPFIDHSMGAAYQYLGDGITEELINALARVNGLDVVSRTTAFALRSAQLDARQIGERLGVTHVVEGSIRVAGQRLRLAVQLVGVSDGFAAWAHTFERALDDIFCVQEEIARSLVAALRPAIRAGGPDVSHDLAAAPLLHSSTTDFEAYALYLRGRQYWNERTPDALKRALQYFGESVARDPDFAHAHAGIADCWAILVDHGIVEPEDGLRHARRAAAAALRLGPDLAEAHTSHALVRQLTWEWTDAEAGLRTALSLNPGYVVARQRLALLLTWLGRTREARQEVQLALRADPLSPLVAATAGWVEYYAGNHDDAIRILRDVLEHQPDAVTARVPLALALTRSGRPVDAVAELRAALATLRGTAAAEPADAPASEQKLIATGEVGLLGLLAYALGEAGAHDEAERIAGRLAAVPPEPYVSPLVLAQAWLGLRRDAQVLAALADAAARRAPQLVYVLNDPMFSRLREHPEFDQVSRRLLAPA